MKIKRKIIEIDEERCDGCGLCVPACAEGSLEIVDGKAKVVADNLCDGLGACLGECPNDALRIIEREAEAFDEVAVEKHLATRIADGPAPATSGCPSAGIQLFVPQQAAAGAVPPPAATGQTSALSHWPIKIRLVPPTAPFLKGADLLVLADCNAVAVANLQSDYLAGRVVMMGCPKFDDADAYVEKFTEIFANAGIQSITVLYMEVPCCAGLPFIVRKALAASGQEISTEEVMITCRGQVAAPQVAQAVS